MNTLPAGFEIEAPAAPAGFELEHAPAPAPHALPAGFEIEAAPKPPPTLAQWNARPMQEHFDLYHEIGKYRDAMPEIPSGLPEQQEAAVATQREWLKRNPYPEHLLSQLPEASQHRFRNDYLGAKLHPGNVQYTAWETTAQAKELAKAGLKSTGAGLLQMAADAPWRDEATIDPEPYAPIKEFAEPAESLRQAAAAQSEKYQTNPASTAGKALGEAVPLVAGAIPTLAAAAAGGPAGGALVAGAQSAGAMKEEIRGELLRQGATPEEAANTSQRAAVGAGIVGGITGGAIGGSGTLASSLGAGAIAGVAQGGTEELIRNQTTGKPFDIAAPVAGAAQGAIAAGLLHGGHMAIDAGIQKTGEAIQTHNENKAAQEAWNNLPAFEKAVEHVQRTGHSQGPVTFDGETFDVQDGEVIRPTAPPPAEPKSPEVAPTQAAPAIPAGFELEKPAAEPEKAIAAPQTVISDTPTPKTTSEPSEAAPVKPEPIAEEKSASSTQSKPGRTLQDLSNVPAFVRDQIDSHFAVAERAGIVDQIEKLSADGRTAKEIARQIKIPSDDPVSMVRSVRAKLGIPGMDDATEFAAWQKAYQERQGGAAKPTAQVDAELSGNTGELTPSKPIPPEAPQKPVESPSKAQPFEKIEELESKKPADDSSPTSIKNRQVDKEREARGMKPAMKTAKRELGTVWDAAMKEIDANPTVQDDLIDELRQKPRALTDREDALLLQRQASLQNEYRDVADQIIKNDDPTKAAELRARMAGLSDRLLDVYDVGKASGTETGRGLNARKMMMNDDYSLAAMETAKRAVNDGRPLSEQERGQIKDLHARLEATQKAYDDYVAQSEQKYSELQSRIVHGKMKTGDVPKMKATKGILDRLIAAGDEAEKRITQKRSGRLSANVDPTDLPDYVVFGTGLLAKLVKTTGEAVKSLYGAWKEKMTAVVGDTIVPHLQTVWDQATKNHNDAITGAIGDQLKEKLATEAAHPSIARSVQKLARHFVAQGITDREQLIDAVHGVVQKLAPDMTRRQTMDAISGYGQYRQLSKDEVSAQLRDLKGQMQQVGKLEDMTQKGEAPKKTGIERREPSPAERRLIQEVNDTKKKLGIQTTDPETQLKSTLDGVKTRLRNQIDDLEHQIETGQKIERVKTPGPRDEEATILENRRDELKEQYEQIFGKPGLTDEERVKLATAAVQKSIADYEKRIEDGKRGIFPGKRPDGPSTSELAMLRLRRKSLVKEYEQLKNPPKDPEQAALAAFKTRTAAHIADLAEKMVRGDFEPRQPRQLTLDPEAQRLKAENERMKQEWQSTLLNDRMKKRSAFEKVMDTFTKYRRAAVLSGPPTLGKLTSAALLRNVFTPIEEVVGGGISKIIPGVASRAPREGGFSAKAEAKAITEGFTTGMKDAWATLRTGKSPLEVLYGKTKNELPPSVVDYIGHIHGALKASTKRAEFARSFQKRIENAIRQGVDVSDPLVQTRIAKDAFVDAKRSIFMQDNRVSDMWKMAIQSLERPNKKTGRVPVAGKALATTGKVLMPIVKVPTNIVAETMQYATGLISGSARLGKAMYEGIGTLKPEEADSIMRLLKKGSLGAAAMALGYYKADSIGGYYQPGEKREKDDVKYGGIRVFGYEIPRLLTHNPLMEVVQIGATIRRVADSVLKKHDAEPQGLGAGATAAALGLIEEVPFTRTLTETAKMLDPKTRPGAVGRLAESIAVPAGVSWAARATDEKDEDGEPVKRQPKGVIENVEMGIPGLRQKIPVKPDAETESYESERAKASRENAGALYNLPIAKAGPEYARMSAADKAKYADVMRDKITGSKTLTEAGQKSLLSRYGLTPPVDMSMRRELNELNRKFADKEITETEKMRRDVLSDKNRQIQEIRRSVKDGELDKADGEKRIKEIVGAG